MGFFLRLLREANLRRGRLPKMRLLDRLPRAREGVFRLGVCSGGGELAWAPLQGDPPHLLWAGTTGSGKTRSMVLLGLLALDWGWDVEVIDFKGGGDYWVLAASGGAKVHVTPKEAVAALKDVATDIHARNNKMWTTPIIRESEVEPGMLVEDRATNFVELPLAIRQEMAWKPRLILIDETASIITDKKGGGMDALREATQLGRSAGVQMVLGMQRPDASLLDGFIKHNIQARILSGKADRITQDMVLGAEVGALADSERVSASLPGRGLATGFGSRPGVTLLQGFLQIKDRYLPRPSPPGDSAAAGGEADRPTEGGGTDASVSHEPPSSFPLGMMLVLIRSILLRPSARFVLRLSALRLLVRPLRSGPFGRDPALADACKRDAGRCRACGSTDRLEADHRRPLWAGGQDRKQNLWCLCHRCHRAKTSSEATVRALMRRTRGRSGYGRPRLPHLPAYAWLGISCVIWGLIDHRWAVPAAVLLSLAVWWELRRPGRWLGIDGLLQNEARAERATYRGSLLGAASATYQTTHRTSARIRYGIMLVSGAYLAAVFLPGLVF